VLLFIKFKLHLNFDVPVMQLFEKDIIPCFNCRSWCYDVLALDLKLFAFSALVLAIQLSPDTIACGFKD